MIQIFGGSPGGAAAANVTGNGVVVNSGGQLSTVDVVASWPLKVVGGDGLDNLMFSFDPALGRLIGANLASLVDQAIPMRAASYIPRRLVIAESRPTPTVAAGSIYTARGRAGDRILDISAASFATLTDRTKILSYDLTAAARLAPYLYLTLDTAEASACVVSIYVFGDVMTTSDDLAPIRT